MPLVFTEFGACLTEAPCTQEIRQVTETADIYLNGWAYWEFKTYKDLTTSAGTGAEGFYNKDGSIQSWKVKALARTYFMATQGVVKAMNFNQDDSFFTGEFTVDTSIEAPTVIYTSAEFYYPRGKAVVLMANHVYLDASQYSLDDADANRYKFTITDKSLNGQLVTIKLTPL